MQVLTGMPSAPVLGGSFDLSTVLALPGGRGHQSLTGNFAISDDGADLLVSAGSGVQLFGPGASRQILAERGAAVAFAPGSHDAVVAGLGVTLVKDVSGAAGQQVIARDGSVPAAVGVAFSADSTKLYLASSVGQGVAVFDLNAGTNSMIPCNCTPAGISGMGNLYRLNEVGAAPLWLLDTTASGPRIVFVPVS